MHVLGGVENVMQWPWFVAVEFALQLRALTI